MHEGLDDRLGEWIERQPVFFVATTPSGPEGHLNVSPKGNRGELAVLDPHRLAYLDQTGSGIETLSHLRDDGRIVLMACAFTGPPRIVRVHGRGRAVLPGDADWPELAAAMRRRGGDPDGPGVRSVIVVEVTRVADSCGYGVPLMPLAGHRPTMDEWAARKGAEGIAEYRLSHNSTSIDGLPGLPRLPRGDRSEGSSPAD